MFLKAFLLLLSLEYCLTTENADSNLHKYERIFKRKVKPFGHMEPFHLDNKRQGGGCQPDISCDPTYPYRTITGWCNNLRNVYWGASGIQFRRRLRPVYGNGIDSPRGEGNNLILPRPRDVSFALHTARDPGAPTNDGITLLVMQWGQFMDHDMVLTPENEVEGCCDDFATVTSNSPDCRPIDVTGDPFYSQFGVRCLQFFRSEPVDPFCSTVSHREQFNVLTAYTDGSQVYGSTFEENEALRDTRDSAFLKISGFNEETCSFVCPLNALPIRPNEDTNEPEFFGGDIRVEEQPGLTSMHTILLRFHNDLVLEFRNRYSPAVVPGETVFEEVRRVVGAVIQQITYNEFLPIVIGKETFDRQINIAGGATYDSRYDSTIDASAPNVFASAVFRFGHTLIPDFFPMPDNVRVQLAESFFRHTRTITRGTRASDFIIGMARNFAQKYDHIMVDAIVNKLFAEEPFQFGSDLLSRNIMRAREHGIPGYNAWRQYAGLPTFTSFDQLYGKMADAVVDIFRHFYRSVDDIDLFPALISEYSDGNSLVGPLLRELIGEQFQRLKFGDRFWFENANQPYPFKPNQLESIHKTLISSLICAYTDVDKIQRFAMRAVSADNPLIPCTEILSVGVRADFAELFL